MTQKHFEFAVLLSFCIGLYFFGFSKKAQLINGSVKWSSNDIPANNNNNARTVLLLAYMRSGSSLTGKLLDQAYSSIYFYEPLRELVFQKLRHEQVYYLENTDKYITFGHSYAEAKIQVLKSQLNCKFNESFANTLHSSSRVWNRYCREYYKCIMNERSFERRRKCLLRLIKFCKKARVRIAKVIRLELNLVSELLTSDPNLRVVHLLRDPRGILSSLLELGMFSRDNLQLEATRLCQNMHRNIRDYMKLKENPRFRNRMMTVFYEDLGEYPIATSKEMFNFLEIPFTAKVQKWIKANMMENRNRNRDPFSVLRRNSHLHVNAWRSKLSYDSVKLIDKSCQSLYEISGYNKVYNDNQLRNTDLKLFNQSSF